MTHHQDDYQKEKTLFLAGLKTSGMLKKLFKYGLLQPSTFLMAETRFKVNALIEAGLTKGEAVRLMSKQIDRSIKHVYWYLRS